MKPVEQTWWAGRVRCPCPECKALPVMLARAKCENRDQQEIRRAGGQESDSWRFMQNTFVDGCAWWHCRLVTALSAATVSMRPVESHHAADSQTIVEGETQAVGAYSRGRLVVTICWQFQHHNWYRGANKRLVLARLLSGLHHPTPLPSCSCWSTILIAYASRMVLEAS